MRLRQTEISFVICDTYRYINYVTVNEVIVAQEESEDTKGVIRIRQSKKNT